MIHFFTDPLKRRLLRCAGPFLPILLFVWLPGGFLQAAQMHEIRKGDSLSSIGRKYGVSWKKLADYNDLSPHSPLIIGRKLRIPEASKTKPAPAVKRAPPPPVLAKSVQRAIDRAKVRPGRWRYIVIHHSGVNTGTVKAMDRYHREVRHMENGLAYDFVIGNGNGMGDGEVAVGNRWVKQLDGGHLASESQNKIALGICLVGNFDLNPPTRKQLEQLRALVNALMRRCHLGPDSIRLHREINVVQTRCPGRKFPQNFP